MRIDCEYAAMNITLSPSSIDDYRTFLKCKGVPAYRVTGRSVWMPDEYAGRVSGIHGETIDDAEYRPAEYLFDYQESIARMAIAKRKFSLFVECGLGKTAIILEFVRHAMRQIKGKRVLIVSPLMVIPQTIAESEKWYRRAELGELFGVQQVRAADLPGWLRGEGYGTIGITNYEAITDDLVRSDLVGAIILDESSMLKSHYGKWGTKLIELGKGIEWKLCATGTPAPNDRIEYANHAVFMDAFPSVNSFLARYFVNRGQTDNRWEMKTHALRPFYRSLSHWCIFMTNPATYGWKDNSETIPPIRVHELDVPMTDEQKRLAFGCNGDLFANRIGGITNRSRLSQIAKGFDKGVPVPTHKPDFIRRLIESWPGESTIVWCKYNLEQESLAKHLGESSTLADRGVASVTGSTPDDERQRIVDGFKAGQIRTLITKPKILGFGLNLQVATKQVFSTCEDSYEEFHQAVKRSNRVGSSRPLDVYLPVTDIERMQMENVLRKAKMVQRDTDEQEELFRELSQEN